MPRGVEQNKVDGEEGKAEHEAYLWNCELREYISNPSLRCLLLVISSTCGAIKDIFWIWDLLTGCNHSQGSNYVHTLVISLLSSSSLLTQHSGSSLFLFNCRLLAENEENNGGVAVEDLFYLCECVCMCVVKRAELFLNEWMEWSVVQMMEKLSAPAYTTFGLFNGIRTSFMAAAVDPWVVQQLLCNRFLFYHF